MRLKKGNINIKKNKPQNIFKCRKGKCEIFQDQMNLLRRKDNTKI